MLNTKRILAALLTALMLTPSMAACSNEPTPTPADTTAASAPSAETTAPVETLPVETEVLGTAGSNPWMVPVLMVGCIGASAGINIWRAKKKRRNGE